MEATIKNFSLTKQVHFWKSITWVFPSGSTVICHLLRTNSQWGPTRFVNYLPVQIFSVFSYCCHPAKIVYYRAEVSTMSTFSACSPMGKMFPLMRKSSNPCKGKIATAKAKQKIGPLSFSFPQFVAPINGNIQKFSAAQKI